MAVHEDVGLELPRRRPPRGPRGEFLRMVKAASPRWQKYVNPNETAPSLRALSKAMRSKIVTDYPDDTGTFDVATVNGSLYCRYNNVDKANP